MEPVFPQEETRDILAWLSMMASPYRQRWGDRWAKTYVIDD